MSTEFVRHSDSFRLLKKGQQFKWVPTNLTPVSRNNWNSSIPDANPSNTLMMAIAGKETHMLLNPASKE